MGTTSQPTDNIDTHEVTEAEIEDLIREGRVMVPSIERSHMVYAYAGVRPLYTPDGDTNGRAASRAYKILSHRRDGLNSFVSVVGGKFLIYRLMAEKVVDEMCRDLGKDVKSRTAVTPLVHL